MAIIHFRWKERRRTVRVLLSVPLKVAGQTAEGEKFSVKTVSHSVSLHGGSIELDQDVALGDVVQLENQITGEQVEGKIVSIRRNREGKRFVAVEFVSKVNFWHMVFPIPGARPMRRAIASKVSAL
jgi:PilZ domain